MKTEHMLLNTWDEHLASEFAAKSPERALATMTAEPYVNAVPLLVGGRGRDELTFTHKSAWVLISGLIASLIYDIIYIKYLRSCTRNAEHLIAYMQLTSSG